MIIDYVREPFVYHAGNVRITIDSEIKSSISRIDMLNADTAMASIPENAAVLEVKYDEFLPDFVRDLLAMSCKTLGEFSKYEKGRLYTI